MANIKINDVKKALPLAKSLLKKLDVDKDKAVSHDESGRIRVRDNYTARNLVGDAMARLSWPDNAGPYSIKSVEGVLDGAIASLEKADKDHDGKLTGDELKNASKVARSFVEFAQKYAGKSVAVFDVKPYEKPGTKAWVELVKKDYFGSPVEPMNKPYFGTALVLKRSELPNAKLKAAYDDLKHDFPGRTVEATSSKVNGETVYFMHAKSDAQYDMRLFDDAGKSLATGTAKPKPGDARARWQLHWD
ncbi:MAG: hypothetical protein QM817_32800 [Archangium sp.]